MLSDWSVGVARKVADFPCNDSYGVRKLLAVYVRCVLRINGDMHPDSLKMLKSQMAGKFNSVLDEVHYTVRNEETDENCYALIQREVSNLLVEDFDGKEINVRVSLQAILLEEYWMARSEYKSLIAQMKKVLNRIKSAWIGVNNLSHGRLEQFGNVYGKLTEQVQYQQGMEGIPEKNVKRERDFPSENQGSDAGTVKDQQLSQLIKIAMNSLYACQEGMRVQEEIFDFIKSSVI